MYVYNIACNFSVTGAPTYQFLPEENLLNFPKLLPGPRTY
jgi:hypothetical protein